MKSLEVLFAPAEFQALRQRPLDETVCVVFDVLRATSSIVTALANGAKAVIPVEEIPEALAVRQKQPDALLAGERNGLLIQSHQTGSLTFDLGNSPREFTKERVAGKTIAITTTNGTRALRACANARMVLPAAFLNLNATVATLKRHNPENLLVICSGTFEQAAYEDVLAAGALCDAVWTEYENGKVADSAVIARDLFRLEAGDLVSGLSKSRNGRRLLSRPELRDDVAFCAQRDTTTLVAVLDKTGAITQLNTRA
jgi:2-phosphosulfolactate phosphatase